MSDDRPRPEYGEYATPEEQAAAMGHKYVAPQPEPPAAVLAAPTAMRQPGYYNRFFTFFLLVLGALNLFGAIPTDFNLASAVKGEASAMGLTSVATPEAINAVGIPLLIANVVLYAATAIWSIIALRRGRTSYYIPIVGFLVYTITALILFALIAPSFLAEFKS